MNVVLPHEILALRTMETGLYIENKSLVAEKADEQSHNYDWHDNAPLDVINQAMGVNSVNIAKVRQLLETAQVIDYPSPNDVHVRVGSLVVGHASFGLLPFVVVGQTLTPKEPYHDAWKRKPLQSVAEEELMVITPLSPIGSAALNAQSGQTVSYAIGDSGRKIDLLIETVDQQWVSDSFAL